jgi:2-polyprenyl-6-methoxyphenol hydroxylase-like FAD-dependent oxidoreductase
MVPQYDIVIVGAGPVGLFLSTCLARWGHSILHIDDRPQPTDRGRADGIQPRTIELLQNMRLKKDLMKHTPARVYEVAFWGPSEAGIKRTGSSPSCPDFIDAPYPFTALLHQGFIERLFLDDMAKHGVTVHRPCTVSKFSVEAGEEYPVKVDLVQGLGADTVTVRAKYLFGGEGGKSPTRNALGIPMKYYDKTTYVWGVMDGESHFSILYSKY